MYCLWLRNLEIAAGAATLHEAHDIGQFGLSNFIRLRGKPRVFFACSPRSSVRQVVRQASGPAFGHELGPNGAKSKGGRDPRF